MFKDKNGRTLSANEALGKIGTRFYAVFEETVLFVSLGLAAIPSHLLRKFLYRLIGLKIGRNSFIHQGLILYTLGKVTIGEGTIIGERTVLDGRGKLQIGSHVDIASEVMIYTSQHDINSPEFRPVYGAVVVEDYVFIGPRAIILPNVRLGKGAIVGAGAVVTRDVEPGAVVGGIPAKSIGIRELKNYSYRLGRPRLFR